MLEWVTYCFRNYAKFDGRAARPEYWWFYFATICANALIRPIKAASLPLGFVLLMVLWAVTVVPSSR